MIITIRKSVEKGEGDWKCQESGMGELNSDGEVRVILIKKTFGRNHLKKCVSHVAVWLKNAPGRGNSQYEDPKAVICLPYVRILESSMWLKQSE